MRASLTILLVADNALAWLLPQPRAWRRSVKVDMASVGIFYGTSTGSTQEVAESIYESFGGEIAAEPVDIDTLEAESTTLASAFAKHDALIVGTPTWNTGADTERSGTGWDELYYNQLPAIQQVLEGKKVAVFGLGDQVSYSENFADATGELFDVFEGLGCRMMGAWSQDGYDHDDSKSIRGDKFCGLLLDMVNQEEMTEARVEKWVAQLVAEGILENEPLGSVNNLEKQHITQSVDAAVEQETLQNQLEENSELLDQSIESHSSGGFTPHHNVAKGKTMWTSQDGRHSFVTVTGSVGDEPPKFAP